MTEDEAKKKWCPFARVASDGGFSFNRWSRGESVGGASPSMCIASACMAWRGSETAEFKSAADAAFRRDGKRLMPTSADREGYCGLAGALQ